MDDFYNMLYQEFANEAIVCIKVNPTYTSKTKKDNSTSQLITITVLGYDKYHNQLDKRLFKFENNHYKISPTNNPQNIKIEDLEEIFKTTLPLITDRAVLRPLGKPRASSSSHFRSKLAIFIVKSHENYNYIS